MKCHLIFINYAKKFYFGLEDIIPNVRVSQCVSSHLYVNKVVTFSNF